eukprot:6202319-Pleurochrysis_carterae.AAC.1
MPRANQVVGTVQAGPSCGQAACNEAGVRAGIECAQAHHDLDPLVQVTVISQMRAAIRSARNSVFVSVAASPDFARHSTAAFWAGLSA